MPEKNPMEKKIKISYSIDEATAFYIEGERVIPVGGITSQNIPYTHDEKWEPQEKSQAEAEDKLKKMLN